MKFKPRLIRFLRINGVLPPLNRLGIEIGDQVKVIPDLGYPSNVGIVIGFEDQSMDDDFIVKVEFPSITGKGLNPLFTEYFSPDELVIFAKHKEENGHPGNPTAETNRD